MERVGPDDLLRSLQTPVILWYCHEGNCEIVSICSKNEILKACFSHSSINQVAVRWNVNLEKIDYHFVISYVNLYNIQVKNVSVWQVGSCILFHSRHLTMVVCVKQMKNSSLTYITVIKIYTIVYIPLKYTILLLDDHRIELVRLEWASKHHHAQPFWEKRAYMRLSCTLFSHILKFSSNGERRGSLEDEIAWHQFSLPCLKLQKISNTIKWSYYNQKVKF